MLNRIHRILSSQIGKRTCLIVVLGLIAGNGFCEEMDSDPDLATEGSRKVGPFSIRPTIPCRRPKESEIVAVVMIQAARALVPELPAVLGNLEAVL